MAAPPFRGGVAALRRRFGSVTPARGIALAAGTAVAVAVMDLVLRAAIRLDGSFDAFAYHLPFAAARAGIPVSFELNDLYGSWLAGFPPLPELLEGVLWRVTGQVAAAQLVNAFALVLFLWWSHRFLRAPFWLVGLIALATPLVIIHASTAYIDLFVGVLVAIGATASLAIWLVPERVSRGTFVGGLAALAAAFWSKYTAVPIAGLLAVLLVAVAVGTRGATGTGRRALMAWPAIAATVAALPYVRNLLVFGNPFWPLRVPVIGRLFPYLYDSDTTTGINTPANLLGSPQPVIFARSLLEIGVPTHYSYRARWIVDQYNSDPNLIRLGGFWSVGVVVFLVGLLVLLVVAHRRRGAIAVAGALVVVGVTSALPQSHELRYSLFLPLAWAGGIGLLYPGLVARWPRAALVIPLVALLLFATMTWENRTYYRPEPATWTDVATASGAAGWWSRLTAGSRYCVVGMAGSVFQMTGPTLTDFHIVSRRSADNCPAGVPVLTTSGIGPPAR